MITYYKVRGMCKMVDFDTHFIDEKMIHSDTTNLNDIPEITVEELMDMLDRPFELNLSDNLDVDVFFLTTYPSDSTIQSPTISRYADITRQRMIPKSARDILYNYLLNLDRPTHIRLKDKMRLAKITGLTVNQVSNQLSNMRKRQLRQKFQNELKNKRLLRYGNWSTLELEFVRVFHKAFEHGVLLLPNGISERQALAVELKCSPMRITKRFSGLLCKVRVHVHYVSSHSI